jgi:hypothetical protein
MRFTLDHKTLFKMVQEVGRKYPGTRHADKEIKVSVASGVLFVIAPCRTGGALAIDTEDGQFTVLRQVFQDMLASYKGERFLTLEASKGGMSIGSFSVTVYGYSPTPYIPRRWDWFGPGPPPAQAPPPAEHHWRLEVAGKSSPSPSA